VSDEALTRGLAQAFVAGRLEQARPGLWLDGAHNPDGARVPVETLEESCFAAPVGSDAGSSVQSLLRLFANGRSSSGGRRKPWKNIELYRSCRTSSRSGKAGLKNNLRMPLVREWMRN